MEDENLLPSLSSPHPKELPFGREMKDPGDEVSKMNESLVWSLTLSQFVWNTKILYLI